MTKTFEVQQIIKVTVDPARFTPEFMKAFNESIHEKDNIREHMEFIAEMVAGGVVSSPSDFLEGYGVLSEFGVDFRIESVDVFEE